MTTHDLSDSIMKLYEKKEKNIMECNKCGSTRIRLIDTSDFINNYVCVDCNTFDDFKVRGKNESNTK